MNDSKHKWLWLSLSITPLAASMPLTPEVTVWFWVIIGLVVCGLILAYFLWGRNDYADFDIGYEDAY